jgi:hypothetical protein
VTLFPYTTLFRSASNILSQFLSSDVDSTTVSGQYYLKPGNSFGGRDETNPSYFAPAFYRYFANVADAAHATQWTSLVSNVYAQLANIAPSGNNGLVPAWCTNNCTQRGDNNKYPPDEQMYQYDSHRTPWRIGLDLCWNGATTAAAAKTYVDKVVGFFAGATASAGMSSLGDIYTATGTVNSDSAPNSMSLIGCAGVGAMGSTATGAATFRDLAWKFLLDGQYTDNPVYRNGIISGGTYAPKPGYTYYNVTVGLMTMMTMSGNFYIMP